MLLLRDVQKSDLDGLAHLASVLNSVNLPDNRGVLEQIVDRSVRSFTGRIEEPFEREYLFVLEDVSEKRLLGTSMIIAQHGTFEAPHIFFQVTDSESYSASIDRHFRHKVLSIGYNYDGPTEIGGLVVDPPYRSGPQKAGKQLSYVRFLYMAMHPNRFRSRVLAELLPPLMPDGRSYLWEACGKKFTGLTYKEADKLSRKNKEFIKELFPSSDIYVTLMPLRAQKLIGEVGKDTRGVKRMLERIGFRYQNHIDPFDGGPHYEADISEISLIREYRTAQVGAQNLREMSEEVLVAAEQKTGKIRFRAVRSPIEFQGQKVLLPEETRDILGVSRGSKVGLIPLE